MNARRIKMARAAWRSVLRTPFSRIYMVGKDTVMMGKVALAKVRAEVKKTCPVPAPLMRSRYYGPEPPMMMYGMRIVENPLCEGVDISYPMRKAAERELRRFGQ